MSRAVIPLYSVRCALRACRIESFDFREAGKRRLASVVGRYMFERGIPTVTVAQSRPGDFRSVWSGVVGARSAPTP